MEFEDRRDKGYLLPLSQSFIILVIVYRPSKSGSLNIGLDLFVHVERQVVVPAGILSRGPRAFPAAKWLESRPCTGGGAVRSIGICDTRLNILEEPLCLFR